MESIKNKMTELTSIKAENLEKALSVEGAQEAIKRDSEATEIKVQKANKDLSKLESDFDSVLNKLQDKVEKLGEAQKTASTAELQLQEVQRRKQLLEEETSRVTARLDEILDKLPGVESAVEENERNVKVKEAEAFAYEEKCCLIETQVEEAQTIAHESHRKQDDAERKLKMVEGELERVSDRAEEYESKLVEFDAQLQEDNKKLAEMEKVASENQQQEDNAEDTLTVLRKKEDEASTRADFTERTVEKLEATIDRLQDAYLEERLKYNALSLQLDQALNDIMAVTEDDIKSSQEFEDIRKAAESKIKAEEAEKKDLEKAKKEKAEKKEKEVKIAHSTAKIAVGDAPVVSVPMEDMKKDENTWSKDEKTVEVDSIKQEINGQPMDVTTDDAVGGLEVTGGEN